MKNKFIFVSLLTFISLGLFIFIWISRVEVGYIDTLRAYNEFNYKKELQVKYDQLEKRLTVPVDSLQLEITYALKDSINRDRVHIEKLQKDLYVFQSKRKMELDRLDKEYFSVVWTQLDEYTKTFGEEHDYKIIFGVKGDGNIVYAKQGMDLTDDLIDFINKKYEGE